MEFIESNFINTTTQIAVQSNTAVVANLFNRDIYAQYKSSGYTGATATTITFSFSATTTISRIAMLNHNLKGFTIYYNGLTANTFALTTTANTTVSDYSSNSETSSYWRTTSVAVTSVSFDLKSTIVSGAERAVGLIVLSALKLDFDRDPSADNYKPLLEPKQIKHELSDGGTRIQYIIDKYSTQIKFKYISESFRNSLRTIYDLHDSFIYCPFGTTTSWDKIFFDTVWTGNFDFYKYSDDAPSSGFSGSINLEETPI